MVNAWLCRFVLCLIGGATLVTSTPQVMLSGKSDSIGVHGGVTTVPAGRLIRKPPNFFDLEGKTVTFTPDGATGYSVRVGSLTWVETDVAMSRSFLLREMAEPAEEPPSPFDDRFVRDVRRNSGGKHTGIALPFTFPFAGSAWTHVYANTNGNVSFAAPETTHWKQRDPWADGTMRSVAAAVDSRSAAGFEAMIAVLWAVYGGATISVDSAPERVAITWDTVARNYETAGPNVFQVRLYPSGAIEFAYRQVSERDGIVGLYSGADARGPTLGAVADPVGDVSNSTVDIASVELVDNGSTVVASVTMAADIPARVSSGSVEYRVFLDLDGKSCAVGLQVSTTGRRELSWCGAAPSVVGYRVQGATLEVPISKTLLKGARTLSWSMDAVWWGRDVYDQLGGRRSVSLDEWGHDLSSMAQTVTGNVFEVFHYPVMSKQMREITSFIYEQVPDDDEIAVLFTDFRIDDLFNTGPGSGPINVPVQGVGTQAGPNSGEAYASDNLLVTMSPVFVGGRNFRESGFGGDRGDRNHALAVFWIAHEAIHRWAAHLRFRNSRSGRIENLFGDWCQCHWSNWLHAPVAHPVWRDFADQPYPEASVMGGALWLDHGDGTFTWQGSGSWKAAGLSDLDLYVMGMIPPEEVGPTFLLRDVVETGTRGRYRATKVPVGIEDIVAAMGPRVPAASEQRKVFRLGVFLLHEGDRAPRADLLSRSRSITDAVARYFSRATGGRMRVVPTVGPAPNRPPAPVGTLTPLTIELGEAPVSVEVAGAFRDADGDPLTYGATSSKPEVASVSVSKSTVTVAAVAAGSSVVTVTATDTDGSNKTATQKFTVTVGEMGGISSRLFVPVILRSQGRAGSFFTSELTLANRGSSPAAIQYTYTAAFGGGSGTAMDSLEPGRQRVIPDAIAYLTSLGVPIGSGSAGGTLAVDFSGLSSPSDAAATVRVATPVEEGSGRAGLAYLGLDPHGLLTESAFVTGLRENRQDRSNLAVQNTAVGGQERITLRVTVFSGDPATAETNMVLPDRTLPPGGFYQYNQVLKMAGFDNGYVKVEKVRGEAPFYAYGVINDNFNSDGSFVFPVTEASLVGTTGQTLPVIIETGNFQSELTVTNFSASEKNVKFSFLADAVEAGDDTAEFRLTLKAGEQRILPNLVRWMRREELEGIGPANRAFVGALFATPAEGDMSGIVIGARTGSPDKRGGQYSLFYNGVPYGAASLESAWIYGLQQNLENRSNLALVNTGEVNDSSNTFEITIYDGSGESRPRTKSVTLGPRRWTQVNGILGKFRQGYVQVRKTSGDNPFVAYGVINDGGRPGERSGDGAFLPAQE